jgi:hypothetical protein
MKRRQWLFSSLIVLIICVLSACRHNTGNKHLPPSTGTLKVILNGPFAIVLKSNDPSRIIVFTPRDPQDKHQFYFNDLQTDLDREKNYHFTLLPAGLQRYSRPPMLDPGLADFNAETDLWQREEYFVTIELPAPDVITFAPPAQPVIFTNGNHGSMPLNHILEYRQANIAKITLTSLELPDARPISASELEKQFAQLCGSPQVQGVHGDSCSEMRKLLSQASGATSTLFFGVGFPLKAESAMNAVKDDSHAISFFNEVLLKRSFPHLLNKELASLPPSQDAASVSGRLVPVTLSNQPEHGRFLPVFQSAVIDCKAGGIVVRTK